MADTHRELFKGTSEFTSNEVSIRRLDDLIGESELVDSVLIKMDVQGYELKVLEGGPRVFSRAKVVIAEASFTELYLGAPLFAEVCEQFAKLGFTYSGAFDQFDSPRDGQPLFQDAIFIKG
jgi:hypothetical protein